ALEWHSRGQRFDPAYLHQMCAEAQEKTLKSYDFKVFSFPKVEKSQYLQKAPVRLILMEILKIKRSGMMKKIRMNCTATLDETFADFLLSRRAKGLAEKTLESYSSQWKAVARHLDTGTDIAALQKADLDDMIVSMREAGLSPNSINSYMRVLKSFFSWCNEQGLTRLNVPLYKAEETVKETYSDAELTALLKKPDIRKTTFAEYRDWVIINFLLNCGSRAATVRAIQIRDVDLDGGVVFYRHTKNRKAQVIPLCSPMIAILREYGRYRGGESTDYLFCTETGTQLTESGLRQSIARYNTQRSCCLFAI
ncbi:tyrosine-type recombinase/integrase, partial [Vescimonas sp.]|uniref:tyrosine-type recombinase/integrase n=2 Tax=Vescimonas sp. TaxID=2892404 RepID=UPI003077CE32